MSGLDKGNGKDTMETFMQSAVYTGKENRGANPPDRPVLTDKERAFADYLTKQVSHCKGCKFPESVTAEDVSYAVTTIKGFGQGIFKLGVDVIRETLKTAREFFFDAKSITKKVLTVVLITAVLGLCGWLVLGAKISLKGG